MTEREAELEAQLRERDEKLAQQEERIRQLEATVQALLRRIYGAKSEKIDPGQLELLLNGDEPGKAESSDGADAPEEDAAESAKNRRKRKRRQGPRWPKNTPVVVEKVLIPEEVLANPEKFREIGEEYSDLPDFVPGHPVIRRTIRKKFVSVEDRDRPPLMVAAPAPPIPGTRCAPGLAAHVLMAS